MERGFKTWSERFALQARTELGIDAAAPLNARAYAAHLGIRACGPADVPGLSAKTIEVLLRNDGAKSCWSAVTVQSGEKSVVILNTSHTPARQSADLMHELAHQIRGHKPHAPEVSAEGLLFLDNYDLEHEQEADWLSRTMLLPRPALIAIREDGMSDEEACERYEVSSQLLGYRMRITGVDRQFAARATY